MFACAEAKDTDIPKSLYHLRDCTCKTIYIRILVITHSLFHIIHRIKSIRLFMLIINQILQLQ